MANIVPANNNTSVQTIEHEARWIVESRKFDDLKSIPSAAVKIMAGRELGLGALASVRGIDFFEGQISLRAHLIAALIKKTGQYNYRLVENTDKVATIKFFEKSLDGKKWEELGPASFTIQEAEKAGLVSKSNWKKYPQDMLYNRAMSRGARMYCPDVSLGAVYETDSEEIEPAGLIEVEYVGEWHDPAIGISKKDYEEVQAKHGNTPGVVELATTKQIQFLASLLSQAGVQDGNAHSLIDEVFDGKPNKNNVSEFIEELKETQMLPSFFLVGYVRRLRQLRGWGAKQVVDLCTEKFGKKSPFDLTGDEQKQLFAELTATEVASNVDTLFGDNSLTPLQKEIGLFIHDVVSEVNIPVEDVENYLLRETDGKYIEVLDMSEEDFRKFDTQQVIADLYPDRL